ncbi:MAG: CBS domain-containing protein [Chloroflexi bacterium]|nr:CBS domain-containing protein [Chloroflexota bacterium]
MKAREIMTRDVVTLAPDAPIQQIARLFRRLGITGAPVVQGGEIVGIVTEIDLIARHARPIVPYYLPLLGANIPLAGYRERRETLRRILGTCARDIMTAPVKTVDADADLEEVATLMVESRANPVPVTEDGLLVGIIGHSDLLQHLEVPPELDLEEAESVEGADG